MSAISSAARRAVKGTVRVLSSTAVRIAGVDVTDDFARRSTVVVAPHPDDETLGCGAAIARMHELGTPVRVIFASDGGSSPRPVGMSLDELLELRRTEARRALEVLGIDAHDTVHLGFDDGGMPGQGERLADALTDVLRLTDPEQVLVTSASDRHPDHVAVARATRAAVLRGAPGAQLFEYPIWQRIPALTVARDALRGGGRAEGRIRRPRLVRADGYLDRKKAALDLYESQLPHFPAGFIADFLRPVEAFTEIVLPR